MGKVGVRSFQCERLATLEKATSKFRCELGGRFSETPVTSKGDPLTIISLPRAGCSPNSALENRSDNAMASFFASAAFLFPNRKGRSKKSKKVWSAHIEFSILKALCVPFSTSEATRYAFNPGV